MILDKEKQSTVYTAAKHSTKSMGTGEIVLNPRLNKDEQNSMKLKNTLCVPGLRNNPLFVARIIDNGYTVTFKKYHEINDPVQLLLPR